MSRRYTQCKDCRFEDAVGFSIVRKCNLEEDMDSEKKCDLFKRVKDDEKV